MELKTLYHGTDIESAKNICEKGINVKTGSRKTDFGQGFYTTYDYEAAVKWAFRKAGARRSKPAIVKLLFDETSAKGHIEYFQDDIRWGQFVINNRNGAEYIKKIDFKDNNLDARYEITCGRIADVDVVDVANELKQSGQKLNDLSRILNTDYSTQIVFHTSESLSYIKKRSYDELRKERG